MHNRQEESVALLGDNSLKNEGHARNTARSQSTSRLSQWGTLALFTLAVMDVTISLYVGRLLLYSSNVDKSTLEVRSQYIGLDELYASGAVNASRHRPIVNMPRLASQVSSAEPWKASQEDQHRHLTNFGTLSPPDRRFQVSRDIHTLLQFRVMDYGMERCSLALRLPAPEDGLSSGSGANSTTRLEVCVLDAPRQLDARRLSWNSRPRCVGNVGTLIAYAGVFTRLPDFPCSWGSLHAYEVSCASASPQCDIDVWSGKNSPYGIFMYQFQTV